MKTGVTYMGHHNPKHIKADMRAMRRLQLDDVLVAAQENDFVHFRGKIEFTPELAREQGLRPVAIFWGALNLFGGGRSSQFLLEHPEGFQVARDGSHRSAGCYVNPVCIARIEEMIDEVAELGFEGYFVDEPTPLRECFCPSCRQRFAEIYGGDLLQASEAQTEEYRSRCVLDYVRTIADYCADNHPALETICCIMPVDRSMWQAVGSIASLHNIGTDVYWVNEQRDVEEMRPLVREVAEIARQSGKLHHEWLQCWVARRGNEQRIYDQGRILVEEQPDALYIWAWQGQVGTTETCEDPEQAWAKACEVLAHAKSG
jgi:hypothetical protein